MLFIVITCQIDRSDSRQILFEIEYNYFIISNIKKINIEKKKIIYADHFTNLLWPQFSLEFLLVKFTKLGINQSFYSIVILNYTTIILIILF